MTSFRLLFLLVTLGALFGYLLATWRPAMTPGIDRATSVARPFLSSVPAATPSREADPTDYRRLENQNAILGRELAEARRLLSEREQQLALTRDRLAELRHPLETDLYSATVNARLRSGETVVTGGYALPDGSRLFAFIRPEIADIDGTTMVRIRGNLGLLDDAAGQSVGLDNLATNAANTLQHGEVWTGDETDTVLATLASTPGTLGITLPDLTVIPSGTGVIDLVNPRLTVRLTPTLVGNNDLDLEVRLEQTPPAPESPATDPTPTGSPHGTPDDGS